MHTALVFASSRLRSVASSSTLPRGRRGLPNAPLVDVGSRSSGVARAEKSLSFGVPPGPPPFPWGWDRSAEKFNTDNAWVNPSVKKVYSNRPALRDAELARLDRSVPSGSMPGCVSGDGVHDLTGNVDEWVLADRDRPEEKGRFSALKGGAWGHVRNACRPVTTSHAPEFTYYFVSFRCCKDPG